MLLSGGGGGGHACYIIFLQYVRNMTVNNELSWQNVETPDFSVLIICCVKIGTLESSLKYNIVVHWLLI